MILFPYLVLVTAVIRLPLSPDPLHFQLPLSTDAAIVFLCL